MIETTSAPAALPEFARRARDEPWLGLFFRTSTAGLAILDPDLRFIRVNAAVARMDGIPAAAHIGKTVREIVPKMADRVEPLLASVIRTGEPRLNFELSGETMAQPGRLRHWVVSFFPLPMLPRDLPGVGVVSVEVTASKEAEAKLTQSREQLRALAARLDSVREDETRRIAREIHDAFGQQLTALQLELAHLENLAPKRHKDLAGQIRRMQTMIDQTIAGVQRISSSLRLGHLELLGLGEAMRWELREFERRTGIQSVAAHIAEIDDLHALTATAAFRIFQEALTNIARHAGATAVQVGLVVSGSNIILRIDDDGRGITPAQLKDPNAIGILGMRERAQTIGGQVVIAAPENGGTLVTATLPRQPHS